MSLWQESKEREIAFEEVPQYGWAFVQKMEDKLKDVIVGDLETVAAKTAPCRPKDANCKDCLFSDKICRVSDNIVKYKWLKDIKEKHNAER